MHTEVYELKLSFLESIYNFMNFFKKCFHKDMSSHDTFEVYYLTSHNMTEYIIHNWNSGLQ